MRELFEICPKLHFLNFFGVFLALKGGGGGWIWSEKV